MARTRPAAVPGSPEAGQKEAEDPAEPGSALRALREQRGLTIA